ncbi:MAG: glycosyltransferase family 4 protein [Mesorhizobium sp.]|uniref:glycosyltransferase n=1 Tax=Mesorhizobium sp. TaxID=1871066 RepID=UPI000FE61A0E|nr:glycosyltransferase [Mesorhizobium sp.]RWH18107.1 MAG: glycosyltransferase family 1 protein [Mesorhizobium sp.]RWH38562.1 MAG: glycosyltransferase family 1 protein [Mesorhizobium sp.]TIM68821.1 MAG: glycosyltransferase family 4 protein [Mesorhizobium sp.]TIR61177.1 MAG: glycosyltransferase family 4 protein [Mesorhizobium sp.]TIR67793.1 MAG: glycosyltransferase family 4 protein [Mesorhizobium sp.]
MSNVVNILIIIEAEIATTQLIEQVIRACGVHGVSYRVQFLSRLRGKDFTPGTIPLFIRCADPLTLCWTQVLVDANRSYIYYIDDNFWRLAGTTPLATYYGHPAVRKSLEYAVSHAQAVVTNSTELAKFVSRFNKHVAVLPTFFDFSLIEHVQPQPTDEVRIGFAGSPSRVDDLGLISGLIDPVLEEFPEVVFEFAGVLPKDIVVGPRVRFFPHVGDYDKYIRFQAERNWAIGLAPLRDQEANRSKTDNKYREYGACRIAGIYSDIPPYRGTVEQSVTGLLVGEDQISWSDALTTLLEQPHRRTAIANAAFDHVKARYDVLNVSGEWANFFSQVAGQASNDAILPEGGSPSGKKILRKLDRLRLHVSVVYQEGGVLLVVRGIIRRLFGG